MGGIYFLLSLVLIAGFTLRVWNINFDQGIGSHPDERSTSCGYAPTIGLPQSWDQFWEPTESPLNPMWDVERQSRRGFTYGHFPLYLGVGLAHLFPDLVPVAERLGVSDDLLQVMAQGNTTCGGFAVAGRLVIAILDTTTIFLIFLLGSRLGSTWDARIGRRRGSPMLGLLAAAFYAFTAQAIQLSHFFAMDPASTTFTVMAVLGAVYMVQDRTISASVLTGIAMGLAIASKFSALPILGLPIVVVLLVLRLGNQGNSNYNNNNGDVTEQGVDEWSDESRPTGPIRASEQLRTILGAILSLAIVGIIFFVASPYAILDFDSFIEATLVGQGRMVRGIADMPFTRQYRNTTPYFYFIDQQVRWGMWWPLGLTALAGTLVMLVNLVQSLWRYLVGPEFSAPLDDRQNANILVWAWLVPYFGLTGAFLAKFNRYMSPVLPFMVLFGAALIWWMWRTASSSGRIRSNAESRDPNSGLNLDDNAAFKWTGRGVAALLAIVAIAGGLFWSLAYTNGVYNTEHPWITSSRWVYQNVPSGSTILWELWDDPIPIRSIPGEPGMDMGSTGLRHIDWSPYEEDTFDKYQILKEKLREADYVAYSSKRIYDSVDELPERYPMTTLYYDGMWDGSLGFELLYDISTPPNLMSFTFEDRYDADESWSLYDHPQVTIFRKTRDLSDEEFDAYFQNAWERAQWGYRGEDSPISGFLNLIGLGSSESSEKSGLINSIIGLLRGEESTPPQLPPREERSSLMLETPLTELPQVDNYRWNVEASNSTSLAVLWWWATVFLLGWLAWPIAFAIFRPLRDRGFFFSKALGWLLSGWLLWLLASHDLAMNSVFNAWLSVGALGIIGLIFIIVLWREMGTFLRRTWPILLVGEVLFGAAFLFFVYIRLNNPDIWQPWFGGEKFMEFAFLNGILRSPSFPPVDPHFAGGFINYYYFGLYLVAYLIKLTGIYAEVAFNLAIPMLFAMTVSHAFGVAYSAVRRPAKERLLQKTVQQPSPMVQSTAGHSTPDEHANLGDDVRIHSTSESAESVANMEQSDDSIRTARVESVDDANTSDKSSEVENLLPDAVSPEEFLLEELAKKAQHRGGQSSTESITEAKTSSPTKPDTNRPDMNKEASYGLPWHRGLGIALLAPFFVTLIGNLDGLGQVVRSLANMSNSTFRSAIPGLEYTVRAFSGLARVVNNEAQLPPYNFWDPSRVLPATINEFPYWSFLFADLHPHLIGIPLSVLFLGLLLALMYEYATDWTDALGRGLLLLFAFALLLGTLASVNLWELPTYTGLGVLGFMVCQYRGKGRINWLLTVGCGLLYVGMAYFLFLPFFSNFTNVGASGIGLVRSPDPLGLWLLIWGFIGFVIVSWIFYALAQTARSVPGSPMSVATGLERMISLCFRYFERLPRLLFLHNRFVQEATLGYLFGLLLWPLTMILCFVLWWQEQNVLALCLFFLVPAFLLLWRRGRAADPGSLFVAILSATGLAILAGTQVIYLKDFLNGGDWYRMNTLFKFFSQVWVIWGIAAAVALPRIWQGFFLNRATSTPFSTTASTPADKEGAETLPTEPESWPLDAPQPRPQLIWRAAWSILLGALLVASFAYIIWGTPARVKQRFAGWQPEVGTLNGLDFMRQGVYTWPDASNEIELQYDWEAIQWLLANIPGNAVIVESDVVGYYREGGSRVASLTGLSGLRGMHVSEQRYPDDTGFRDGQHREFWSNPDPNRTMDLIRELDVSLIYVGQLEQYHHPDGVRKLEEMAQSGQIMPVFENERVIIYSVIGNEVVDGG